MDSLPINVMLKIFSFFTTKELLRMSRACKRFRKLVMSMFWQENCTITILPDNIYVRNAHLDELTVSLSNLDSFSVFLQQIPFLESLKIVCGYFNEHTTFSLHQLRIYNLGNLQCLNLNFSARSVIPLNITFPKLLKHFNLNFSQLDVCNRPMKSILLALHHCCPYLEHISVNSTFPPSKCYFLGLDFMFDYLKDTLRTAHISTSRLTELTHTSDCIGYCSKLEALVLTIINGIIRRPGRNYDYNLLNPISHAKLQILGLESRPRGELFKDFFNCSQNVFPNIRVFCLSNFYVTERDFDSLLTNFPNLLILHFNSCPNINFNGLLNFVRNCGSLRQLCLDRYFFARDDLQKLINEVMQKGSLELFLSEDCFAFCENLAIMESGNYTSSQLFVLAPFFKWNIYFICMSDLFDQIQKLIVNLLVK